MNRIGTCIQLCEFLLINRSSSEDMQIELAELEEKAVFALVGDVSTVGWMVLFRRKMKNRMAQGVMCFILGINRSPTWNGFLIRSMNKGPEIFLCFFENIQKATHSQISKFSQKQP